MEYKIQLQIKEPWFGGYSAIVIVNDKEYNHFAFYVISAIAGAVADIADMEDRQLVWRALYDNVKQYIDYSKRD